MWQCNLDHLTFSLTICCMQSITPCHQFWITYNNLDFRSMIHECAGRSYNLWCNWLYFNTTHSCVQQRQRHKHWDHFYTAFSNYMSLIISIYCKNASKQVNINMPTMTTMHSHTLSGCTWIDNAIFTDRTLKRNGSWQLDFSRSPRASWWFSIHSAKDSPDEAINDGPLGCVPIHSCTTNNTTMQCLHTDCTIHMYYINL